MTTQLKSAPAMAYQTVSKQSEILGASPHKLIELLLAGASKNIDIASIAIENGDIESRGIGINKTIDIISELRSSLDLDKGGEIAANLDRLYDYIGQALIDAHLNVDAQALDNAKRLVSDLLETWKQIKGNPLAE